MIAALIAVAKLVRHVIGLAPQCHSARASATFDFRLGEGFASLYIAPNQYVIRLWFEAPGLRIEDGNPGGSERRGSFAVRGRVRRAGRENRLKT